MAFAARRHDATREPGAAPPARTPVTAEGLRAEFAQLRKPVVLERASKTVVDLTDDTETGERSHVSSLAS